MHAIRIALGALLLAGCTTLHYHSEAEAYVVIGEAASHPPTSTYLDSRFLGFRDDPDVATGTPQDIRERIYFASLDSIQLRRHGRGYLVRLKGPGGNTLRDFHFTEREQAERLVDAFAHYRANAPAFSGLK